MNNLIIIKPSKKKDKKFDAILPNSKIVSFGSKGYSDFTIHKDQDRKRNYLARHAHDPRSIFTPGGLSRDILWSKPNLKEAISYAENKHKVKIKLQKS